MQEVCSEKNRVQSRGDRLFPDQPCEVLLYGAAHEVFLTSPKDSPRDFSKDFLENLLKISLEDLMFRLFAGLSFWWLEKPTQIFIATSTSSDHCPTVAEVECSRMRGKVDSLLQWVFHKISEKSN